jgi:hypothetical protein
LAHNEGVVVTPELLADIELDGLGIVVANDAARSTFTAVAGDSLLALDEDLRVIRDWHLDAPTRAWHSTSPSRGLALLSGASEVLLLDHAGGVLWSHPHPSWSGNFESGCTWFDGMGEPFAVVPAPSYGGCLILRLELETGQTVAEQRIAAAPAGINPVHHPDGWVGLSEGEGQDATRSWWVRASASDADDLELLDGSWDDWVLSDVDATGTKVITTPHDDGPLVVRAFPDLIPLREITVPDDEHHWDFTACFAGDQIIARLLGDDERLISISQTDVVADHGLGDGWIIPAAAGSWLAATRSRLRRWRLTPSGGG